MELYFIRHAQSQNNALPEHQRVHDPPITELGVLQAKHLASWAKTLNLTQLITSPFRRALETTRWMSEATRLTPEVRIDLHEQGGCYDGHQPNDLAGQPGMTREEIAIEFPEYKVEPALDENGWWGSKPYETWDEADTRTQRLLNAIRDEFGSRSGRVAFVMHAHAKMLLLKHFHTERLEVPWNASTSKVLLTGSSIKLVDYNRADYLPTRHLTL